MKDIIFAIFIIIAVTALCTLFIIIINSFYEFLHKKFIDNTLYQYGTYDNPLKFSYKGKEMIIYSRYYPHNILNSSYDMDSFIININGNDIVELCRLEHVFYTSRRISLNSAYDTIYIWGILRSARKAYNNKTLADIRNKLKDYHNKEI